MAQRAGNYSNAQARRGNPLQVRLCRSGTPAAHRTTGVHDVGQMRLAIFTRATRAAQSRTRCIRETASWVCSQTIEH
jgi:hypothetical protein